MPSLWSYTLTPAEAVLSSAVAPSVDVLAIKDIAIGEDGDMLLPPRLVSGADAIVQRLRIRFQFWLKAWFLDQRRGIPYIEQILVKGADLPLIESIFRKTILSCYGIANLKNFSMAYDRPTRQLTIETFEAVIATGQLLTLEQKPFILI